MSEQQKHPLYFITLMPPENIRAEIEIFKKEIKEKFQIKHALKLPAHITVQIPFRMPENKEDILINKLHKFCDKNKAFETKLDGFDKFSKQVIFIKVKEHQDFIILHEKLQKMMLDFLNLKSHEISSNIHPHITIATRDLKRSMFQAVWNDFKDREYTVDFTAKNLFLLKHNGKSWDVFRKFSLSS